MEINNSTPSFGMALRKPYTTAAETLVDYANFNNKVNYRGFKQFKKEMDKLTKYDLVFNEDKSVNVIENLTGKVMDTFGESPRGITGLEHFGRVRYPFRKILAKLFNPKKFLPYNIYSAGERAKELEKAALKTESTLEKIDGLYSAE